MKYSKVFGKTVREAEKDMQIASHKLLYQGGFVRESVPGRFYFLPMGMRVRDKLMKIIAEEMDKSGAQKMLSPTLHPLHLWEETNRNNAAGFELMGITDRRGDKFVLGGTGEEMFVDVVRKFTISYKDLPFNIYQFSEKFRDELRARGGMLRAREFTMKDAYSFDRDEEGFLEQYKIMGETYTKIFLRCGMKTDVVPADNGYIGGEYCHEYVVQAEAGESRYFISEDGSYIAHEDVAQFEHEDVNVGEEVLEMEIVDQPDWVMTMEDNVKHYEKDAKYFLKNVVYRTWQGDIVIATIRGDLEVNKTKLEHLLNLGVALEDADDSDLEAIGTKSGSVHSWGHTFTSPRLSKDGTRECEVIYVADNSLKTVVNFIGGQKSETSDTVNVNYGRDFKHDVEGDIAMAKEGFLAPGGKMKLVGKKGVEVANIFQLGYHYTDLMSKSVFIDSDGKSKPYYMGCYGIGIGRTIATVAEVFNDEKGIRWPMALAPYHVHIVTIGKDQSVAERAESVYQDLTEAGIEVLFDDRDKVSPGIKLADADLIGIPIRVVVSDRTLEKDSAEVKLRSSEESSLVALSDLVKSVVDIKAEISKKESDV